MKNLAKKIAFAMALLAVFFTGCNNDVGGSIGNGALLALLQQKPNESSSTIKSLNVIATSNDTIVRASALYIFYNFFKASFVFIAKHLLSRNRQILCLCKLRKISLFQYVYDKFSEHIHICS